LTLLLLPALQAAAPAWVAEIPSSGHQCSDIDFKDINYRHRPYDRWKAYGQSKTVFVVVLTHHFAERGVTANAVNPGDIRTGLQKYLTQEDMRSIGWIDERGNPFGLEDTRGRSLNIGVGSDRTGIGKYWWSPS
jgi:NAD(P)-dependent dehydrogenase (short-subunit alcohol dehydrogenase family)